MLTDLNPWVVSFHLLCSLAIIGVAVRLLLSVSAPLPPPVRGPGSWLAWVTFAAAWAVLYVGTVVTGSGPHAGDVDTARNGLDPLQVSQLHADLVFLFVGLTLGLLFALLAVGASPGARRAVVVLLCVEVAQGTVGFVQYATDLPVVLVGFHMLGAAGDLRLRDLGAAAACGTRFVAERSRRQGPRYRISRRHRSGRQPVRGAGLACRPPPAAGARREDLRLGDDVRRAALLHSLLSSHASRWPAPRPLRSPRPGRSTCTTRS